MTIRLSNMPPALKALVPKGYAPKKADFVVLDRKGLEGATKAYAEADTDLLLLHAFTRALGTEQTTLKITKLPKKLQASAKKVGNGGNITGEHALKALEDPSKLDDKVRVDLPAIVEQLHVAMGHEEMLKGTLSAGLPQSRATEAELSKWYAAGVQDIRTAAGKKKIDKAGAEKLIKLTKQVILNNGGGLITRAFFDDAVKDLHSAPGLTNPAIKRLNEFRVQTQPGRTSHRRTGKGALLKIDAKRRQTLEMKLCNETQNKVIEVCTKDAKAKVKEARKRVLEAIKPWGYGAADLDEVIRYVARYAPVTVQFNPDRNVPGGTNVIDSLLEDPFYKNQFQTKVSGGSLGPHSGSGRDGWEKKCFAGVYHEHDLIPDERPKYVGLSGLNSPKGNGGNWYGTCFFEVRNDVKWRTTFTPRNSSGCNHDDVTTIETLDVLLDQIRGRDSEYLKNMFLVAKGDKFSLDKSYNGSYIEAQVHGDIDLTRDVDFLVIDKKFISTPYGAKLLELAAKIGATVKYTDQSKFYMADPTDKAST